VVIVEGKWQLGGEFGASHYKQRHELSKPTSEDIQFIAGRHFGIYKPEVKKSKVSGVKVKGWS